MFLISEYHNILRKYGITESGGHLLLPKGSKDRRAKIAKSLFDALGDMRAENPSFRLIKNKACPYEKCVSPQCYHFMLSKNIIKSTLDQEDVIDIASSMNLDDIEAIGPMKYLEQYNSTQIDILKLSLSDFKLILAYMKGLKNDN